MELGTKEFNDLAMEMFGGKPKQQTAVEWLCEQYHLKQDIEIVKQAKEIEKEQIIDARVKIILDSNYVEAEQYYNETFKNK